MADSVQELIMKDIESTVQTVVAPTYETDVKLVSRKLQVIQEVGQYPAVLIVFLGETKDNDDTPSGLYTINMDVELECWLLDDELLSETDVSNFERDVETALLADVTRGGNAINTTLTRAVPFLSELGAIQGVKITLQVFYRHAVDDPTSTVPKVNP